MNVIRTRTIETPITPMLAGVCRGGCGDGVCLLEFPGSRAESASAELARVLDARIDRDADDPLLDELEAQLGGYFAGGLRAFDLPLVKPGTAFQRAVWDELLRIPYGETVSYGEIAVRVGREGAQRAVGAANGKNRIAIVVPCHRVIDASGGLHGYGGGLERKRALLEHEGALAVSQPALF